MNVATDQGMQLYGEYHERGRPDCVVLLHSLGLNMRVWDGVVPELTSGAAVLTLDLRGHGLSWRPEDDPGITIERLADDVAASVRALGRSSVTMVGTSLGAAVALALATRQPDLVRGLGLVSLPGSAASERLGTMAAEAEEGRLATVAAERVRSWFSDDFAAAEADKVTELTELYERNDADGFAGACRALAAADLDAWLRDVDAPAVLVTGEDDALATPDDTRASAALVRDARVEVVPGTRHLAVVEDPAAVARALLPLLGSA